MKRIKQRYQPFCFLLFFFVLLSVEAVSQSVFLCAGRSILKNNIQISFSLGQTFSQSVNQDNGYTFFENIQQPFDFFEGRINQISGSTNEISVAPNPFNIYIQVKFDHIGDNQMALQLSTVCGKIILQEFFRGPEYTFNTSNIDNGIYLLIIKDAFEQIKAFKLIKY